MTLAEKELLIVDDDAEFRAIVRRILEGSGIRVREAPSVPEGLELASRHVPNLIFLDLHIPGQKGFAFLQARLGLPSLRKIPVVVLSASTDRNEIFHSIGLGAVDYLLKPIQPSLLLQKVRKHLRDAFVPRYIAPSEHPHSVKVSCGAKIREISGSGLTLTSPVKFAPPGPVRIASALVDAAGLPGGPLAIGGTPALPLAGGSYLIEASVPGLTEAMILKLRKIASQLP